MKKFLALAVLMFAVSAFAGTFPDPNGATTFTQNSQGVMATNISTVTQDVRFVQPGIEINLTLQAGESREVGNPSLGFYEWTCPSPYVAVIQGTNTMPTYDSHNTYMSCK
jgi:hypothetical protein